jgi:hypothetical protein
MPEGNTPCRKSKGRCEVSVWANRNMTRDDEDHHWISLAGSNLPEGWDLHLPPTPALGSPHIKRRSRTAAGRGCGRKLVDKEALSALGTVSVLASLISGIFQQHIVQEPPQ